MGCKKCGKSDNPEWMLLCDKCDAGWHASCLRPALMVIPEGDWYCPDCQHSGLIEGLEAKLKSYAALYKSKEAEIKRRERLAFVSMSLQNIIPRPPKRNLLPKNLDGSEAMMIQVQVQKKVVHLVHPHLRRKKKLPPIINGEQPEMFHITSKNMTKR